MKKIFFLVMMAVTTLARAELTECSNENVMQFWLGDIASSFAKNADKPFPPIIQQALEANNIKDVKKRNERFAAISDGYYCTLVSDQQGTGVMYWNFARATNVVRMPQRASLPNAINVYVTGGVQGYINSTSPCLQVTVKQDGTEVRGKDGDTVIASFKTGKPPGVLKPVSSCN